MNAVIPAPIDERIRPHLDRLSLSMCMSCGACSSGCPAAGLEDMNLTCPQKLYHSLR